MLSLSSNRPCSNNKRMGKYQMFSEKYRLVERVKSWGSRGTAPLLNLLRVLRCSPPFKRIIGNFS